MPNLWRFVAASVLALAAAVVEARTLTLSAERVQAEPMSAQGLRLVVAEHAGVASLQLDAEKIAAPRLALAGRLAWTCELQRADDNSRRCAGPVQFHGDDGVEQTAELAVRLAEPQIELALSRDGSRVALVIPFAGGEPFVAELQRIPAAWLKAPLAQAWKGGELRSGVIDATANLHADGHVDSQYAIDDLDFNTLDGTVSGHRVTATGRLESTPEGQDIRLIGEATLDGGALQVGAMRIVLPDQPVEANLDAMVRANGRWEVARFAWRDSEALALEASGELEPAAFAPLRSLAVRVDRAVFPLAAQRYAKDVLAVQGLGKWLLKGSLSGEFAVDPRGLQRLALNVADFAADDGVGHVRISGIRGGIDWAADGERPVTTLAWKSARVEGLPLSASSSRWQSRAGALHLQGNLQTKLLGGELKLMRTVLHPLATQGEHLSTAFALHDIGYDSKDGTLAAERVAADGTLRVSGSPDEPQIQLDASLHGGEVLAGPVYVKLPATPVRTSMDAALAGTRWAARKFDWSDPGALDFSASGEFDPTQARPLRALQIELREARLGPALDRYAHSWLASKGYAELGGSGALSGTLKLDADGLQRFAFSAHDVGLRDGAGRFVFSGIDGGVDWEFHRDTPPTNLSWKSIELFRIPLGAAQAAFESQRGAIVLAQPLAIDVLGGQLRLEKLSLQPRSPRGERYAGSFAIVGLEMAQVSTALGWPKFPGNLSGGIPEIEFAGDTIELHGGLDLYVFDGHVGVSGVTLERPFGVAPSLGADIHFERLDLDQVTSAFSFGGMSGRLDGTIGNLRLVDWSPVAFDAWLRTNGGGRMSYNAVSDLTSIGGGGLSDNLQTMALKIFDTFGYRRLGIRCKLVDEVCAMGGIDPLPAQAATAAGSADDSYTIVEGSGLPSISIVGHRRRVDWPTLVRRLQEATQGQGPVIK